MKNLLLLLLFLNVSQLWAQEEKIGRVERISLVAKSLENSGGEEPLRHISIYLPPNYSNGSQRYPVIYYLHGFMGNDNITANMKEILDEAILSKKIRPFIWVIPDHNTKFSGSFYTNSSLTGNWEDFTVNELVTYIDSHYRTLATRESRGIGGHSMGGYGAFKLAMLHPEVFSSVYAMSPGLLAFVKEFGPNSTSYRELQQIKTPEELQKTYYPKVLVAVARAWSPNPSKAPFFCDFPFTYEGDKLIIHQEIIDKWEAQMPVYMIDKYANNLRRLKAIKLDWGRNDSPRFPIQIGMLSQKLENLGINHFAEEYIGDHVNKIWTKDGRVLHDLLPFFNEYLSF